jgi:hypothetical protein
VSPQSPLLSCWGRTIEQSPFPPAAFTAFAGVGSEEARSVALALASVRRTNWTCRFPASSFHEDALL